MATQTQRRVRITFVADVEKAGHRDDVLRVRQSNGSITYLHTAGLEVEDVTPARTWTDGDVVQSDESLWTLTRIRGQWQHSMAAHRRELVGYWTDDMVTHHLAPSPGWGSLTVLRYQAGE